MSQNEWVDELMFFPFEKYISVTKHFEYLDIHFRFFDSLRLIISSSDKLASYLTGYNITRGQFQDHSDEKFELLVKGVFHTSTSTRGKSWRRGTYRRKIGFSAHSMGMAFPKRSIVMHSTSGNSLIFKIWASMLTCTCKRTFYF